MNVPFSSESVPKNGTKGTARHSRAHKGTAQCAVPFPVPFCPASVPLSVPVEIHGAACTLVRRGGGYAVMRDQQLVAEAPTRFLVVARAALNLAPARAFAGADHG